MQRRGSQRMQRHGSQRKQVPAAGFPDRSICCPTKSDRREFLKASSWSEPRPVSTCTVGSQAAWRGWATRVAVPAGAAAKPQQAPPSPPQPPARLWEATKQAVVKPQAPQRRGRRQLRRQNASVNKLAAAAAAAALLLALLLALLAAARSFALPGQPGHQIHPLQPGSRREWRTNRKTMAGSEWSGGAMVRQQARRSWGAGQRCTGGGRRAGTPHAPHPTR